MRATVDHPPPTRPDVATVAAPACPVCRSQVLMPVWTVDGYGLSRCDRCTHLFVSSGLTPGVLNQAYERDYYTAGDSAVRSGYEDYLAKAPQRLRGFAQRLRELERFTVGRGRLLDFGCAVGLFVKVAADAGWDAIGIERSTWAAEYGRRQYGLTIVDGSEDCCVGFGQSFDLVTMWDVLEHLEDPRGTLQQVASWLKPGGVLALNTVDSASRGARLAGKHWRHLAPPHHLQYFTRDSLLYLLRDCGFRLRAVHSQGVMWGADLRREHLGGLSAVTEAAATHWRARSLAGALHLLDKIEIVATRQGALQDD